MMLDDDEQLIQALRDEVDGPAPVVQTKLSDIVPRGLRRRRLRQASSVAAAVAVVVGVGVVATTVKDRPMSSDEPAIANTVTDTVNAEANWARADHLGAQEAYGSWTPAVTAPPPPGASVERIPLCVPGTNADRPEVLIPPEFRERVAEAVRSVVPRVQIGPISYSVYAKYNWMDFDITDSGGTGSVHVTAAKYRGKAIQAADREAFDMRNCLPPRRQVLGDNTVMQVYPVEPSEPFQSLSRSLRIYLPTGVAVEISVRNFGSPDSIRQKGTDVFDRFGEGRPTLPLTERELAQVAERLMAG